MDRHQPTSGKRPDQANRSVSSKRSKSAKTAASERGKNRALAAKSLLQKAGRRPAMTTGTPVHRKKQTARKKPVSIAKHRRRRLKLHRLAFLLALCVGLGYGAFWFIFTGLPILYLHLGSDIRYISTSDTPLPYSKASYTALSREVAAYLSRQSGQYSVAGTDLKTGAEFGYDQSMDFSAAQTEALPVTMTLYSEIAAGMISKDAIVRLTAADEEAGSGYIGGMPYGTPFTVTELARAAIDQGDVVALNMLIRKLGSDQINSFIAGMGSTATLEQPYLLSPQDLNLSLSYLYTMDQAHPHAVAPLMQDLRSDPREGRITSGFPTGTPLVHITGDWPNEFHDAGIIWTNGHPVALAICSDGVTSSAASSVESHVARLVNQFEQTGYVPPS